MPPGSRVAPETAGNLKRRGIHSVNLEERTDAASAAGEPVLHVLCAFARDERWLTPERTRDGIADAGKPGRKPGPPQFSAEAVSAARRPVEANMTPGQVAKQLNIGRAIRKNFTSAFAKHIASIPILGQANELAGRWCFLRHHPVPCTSCRKGLNIGSPRKSLSLAVTMTQSFTSARGEDHVEVAARATFGLSLRHQARPDQTGLLVERENSPRNQRLGFFLAREPASRQPPFLPLGSSRMPRWTSATVSEATDSSSPRFASIRLSKGADGCGLTALLMMSVSRRWRVKYRPCALPHAAATGRDWPRREASNAVPRGSRRILAGHPQPAP